MKSCASKSYWDVVEPYWEAVDIYADPEEFLRTLAPVPSANALLLAAHWCQSEIRNGGFHQFFTNPTGVLAPEALDGFAAIGRPDLASLLREAMSYFGAPYPRERVVRSPLWTGSKGNGARAGTPSWSRTRRSSSVSNERPSRQPRTATHRRRNEIRSPATARDRGLPFREARVLQDGGRAWAC